VQPVIGGGQAGVRPTPFPPKGIEGDLLTSLTPDGIPHGFSQSLLTSSSTGTWVDLRLHPFFPLFSFLRKEMFPFLFFLQPPIARQTDSPLSWFFF